MRTRDVDAAECRARLAMAEAFAQQGQDTMDLHDSAATRTAAVSSSVLASIAAADVIAGLTLGRMSRDSDHASAAQLLAGVTGGPELAKLLRVAMAVKTRSQYTSMLITENDSRRVARSAEKLLAEARRLARGR